MNIFFLSLIELLIKSVAITLVVLLVIRWRARLSAAQRSLLWTGAFAVLLLLPLTKFFAPQWSFSIGGSVPELAPAVEPAEFPARPDGAAFASSSAGPGGWRPGQWQTICLIAWGAGALILLGRKAIGFLRLVILMRRSRIENDISLLVVAAEIQTTFGIRQKVGLRTSALCPVPLTWGAGRCVIMLPAGVEAWPESRLRSALLHEFAHIARLDWATRLIAQLAAIFFWPNPLIWAGLRSFTSSQEQACDDKVIAAGTSVEAYTGDLLACARSLRAGGSPGEALAMARTSTLEIRIVALLDDARNMSQAGAIARTAILFLGMSLLALSASAQVTPASTPAAKLKVASSALDKAKRLVISKVSFQETPMTEVAAILQKKSREADPEGTGLKFYYVSKVPGKVLSLTLTNISLLDVLGAVDRQAGLAEVGFTADSVVLMDPSARKEPGAENVRILRSEQIILPKIEMKSLTLSEAAAYLQEEAKLADPEKLGFNVSCEPGWSGRGESLNLALANIPLSQVILYVARLSGSDLTLSQEGAIFTPGTPGAK